MGCFHLVDLSTVRQQTKDLITRYYLCDANLQNITDKSLKGYNIVHRIESDIYCDNQLS